MLDYTELPHLELCLCLFLCVAGLTHDGFLDIIDLLVYLPVRLHLFNQHVHQLLVLTELHADEFDLLLQLLDFLSVLRPLSCVLHLQDLDVLAFDVGLRVHGVEHLPSC